MSVALVPSACRVSDTRVDSLAGATQPLTNGSKAAYAKNILDSGRHTGGTVDVCRKVAIVRRRFGRFVALVLGPVMILVLVAPIVSQTFGGVQPADGRTRRYQEDLREVFPQADGFVSVDGRYKHFRAYTGGPDESSQTLVGYAFFTNELGARSRGYAGVMRILVGLALSGEITGVKAVEHYEPYGYRSIDLDSYRVQFTNKTVLDPFKVGEDIDAVTGATITVRGATGAIKVSARRMAREFVAKRSNDEE